MIKIIFQIIFSFITIPFDICYLIIVFLLWILFSCKEKDERFNNLLPDNGPVLKLSDTLWKL